MSRSSAQRQRQLLWPGHTVLVDETLQRSWDVLTFIGAGLHKRFRDLLRYVPRQSLCHVEGDHPNRHVVLAFKEVLDDRLSVGALLVGLSPAAARPAEIIKHKVHIVIG